MWLTVLFKIEKWPFLVFSLELNFIEKVEINSTAGDYARRFQVSKLRLLVSKNQIGNREGRKKLTNEIWAGYPNLQNELKWNFSASSLKTVVFEKKLAEIINK